MAAPMTSPTTPVAPRYLRAAHAFDGVGNVVLDAVLELHGTRVAAIGGAAEFGSALDGESCVDYGEATLLPGLIDMHAHVSMPADGRSYSEVMRDPDEVWALTAYQNVARHLEAGVTTIRDNGARNRVTFAVRDFLRDRDVTHPRLLLAGRPVTRSDGHMAWCNGSADRPEDIRKAIRLLAAEGADHIKLVASGGGTPGTVQGEASYSAAELRVAVEAAHELGLRNDRPLPRHERDSERGLRRSRLHRACQLHPWFDGVRSSTEPCRGSLDRPDRRLRSRGRGNASAVRLLSQPDPAGCLWAGPGAAR